MKSLSFRIYLVFFVISAFLVALLLVHKSVVSNLKSSIERGSNNIRNIDYSENLIGIINTIRLNHARTVALSDTTQLFRNTLQSNRIAIDSFLEVSKMFKYSIDSQSEAAIIDTINLLFKEMNRNYDNHIKNKLKIPGDYFQNVVPQYLQIQKLLFSLFSTNLERINKSKENNFSMSMKYSNTIEDILVGLIIIVFVCFVILRFFFFNKIKNRHIAIDEKLVLAFPNIFDIGKSDLNIETKINKIIDFYQTKEKDNLKFIISEKSRINNILNNYSDSYFVLDDKLKLVYFNHSAELQFAWTKQESLGQEFNEIAQNDDLFNKFRYALNILIEDMTISHNCHKMEEFVYKNTNYCVEIYALCNEAKSVANYFIIRFFNSI